MDKSSIYIDQAITLLAQIEDAFEPGDYLLNTGSNISSVYYTAYYIRDGAFSQGTPVAITGHNNVEVSTDCVLSALQTSEKWTIDNNGFSFLLVPDVSVNPLFTQIGEYSFKITINPTSGNPIVFYIPVTVKPIDD